MNRRSSGFRGRSWQLASTVALVLAGVFLGTVDAQTTAPMPPAPVPPNSPSEPTAPSLPQMPGAEASPPPATAGTSQQLSRSGGVIHPPENVDPKMAQPAPPTSGQSMPVIPPPGSPGGNNQVQPK